jgi:HTH-type transcriptional regulator/antitoxin HigA
MLKPIETEEEFDLALKRFNEIFDAPDGTPEGDEAIALADLIEAYDNAHYPIHIPEPAHAKVIGTEGM